MAGVPDQAVAAEIEDAVEREAKLDDAEVRGEMSGARAEQVAEHVADLGPDFCELRDRHRLEWAGVFELRKVLVHGG